MNLPSWLRRFGPPALLLGILYAFTGRLSFLARVDNVLVTPVFFLPEAIALAFALRFGPAIWPGIFFGQLILALHQGLAWPPSLAISAINSLEAVGAVWLYRRLGGETSLYDLRSWLVFQGMIFLILQPFSATFGTLTLLFSGVIGDFSAWVNSWQNWWIGNAVAQSQLTPLLLLLMHRENRIGWAKKILLPLGVTAAALWFALAALPAGGIGTSLVLFQPLLVGFGLALGLKSVCVSSVLISVSFLYATSHGLGPFFRSGNTSLLDLNVFLIGISLIGQFLAVLFRQLEDRRRVERELAEARKSLEKVALDLTENIPVGTYTMSLPPGSSMAAFTFVSRRFLEMTGLRREDVLRDPGHAFACVHPEEREAWIRKNVETFQARRPFAEECRILVQGEVRWVRAESVPRQLPDGGWVWEGALSDITALKHAEQSLRQAHAKEQASEKRQREEILRKLKTSLAAAGIAHEINQPLSQILLQTEITLQKLRSSPGPEGETSEALRNIRSRTEQVVETIETIRALLGNVATGHGPLDLANVIRSAVLYLQPVLQKAGAELRSEGLPAACPATGDDAQLHLMVTNLLRNAVQAVEGRPAGRRQIALSLTESPEGFRLAVEDAGPGFSAEQQLISELPLESTKPEGMGMGLYLIRTVVENHRGRISFGRSPSLGGARVEVTLPR